VERLLLHALTNILFCYDFFVWNVHSLNNYELVFKNDTVVIAFDGNRENGEIELRYDISEASESETLTQQIYAGEDCDVTPEAGFISVVTDVITDASAGGYTPINSTIGMDTATVSNSSDCYNLSSDGTSANITFCVRTDFGSISYFNGLLT